MAKLNINGKVRDVQVEADTPLLWVIREQVGLTGTKYGCGVAQCGACSVHINGEVQRSCSIPRRRREGRPTGSSPSRACRANSSHPVQKAWAALDVPQCGYCQSGQIMAAAALLKKKPQADRRGHRRGDDQHLPLRHLSAHPRGGPHGSRQRRPPSATGSKTLREVRHDKRHSATPQVSRAASSSSARPRPAAVSRSASTCRSASTRAGAERAGTRRRGQRLGRRSSPTTPA